MSDIEPVTQFSKVLDSINVRVLSYDPSKTRPLKLSTGPAYSIDKFASLLRNEHVDKIVDYPEIAKATKDVSKLREIVEDYSRENKLLHDKRAGAIPDHLSNLVLYWDVSEDDPCFFVATKEGRLYEASGNSYIRMCGMDAEAVNREAIKVVRDYRPRSPGNTFVETGASGEPITIFNTYQLPEWMRYEGKLPDKLPEEFDLLVRHLFPIPIERKFFFHWLYGSLFDRAMTFLVLCGTAGAGKNVLKMVLRALHGDSNTVDGKGSTLKERFNSQLAESTLIWFDELRYTEETENVMKEMQNDSISIERKGVDASRSTRIYASAIVSNNKPRDNFIAFDARKFVPLQIAKSRLERSLTQEQIDKITKSVETAKNFSYDIKYIAQIGRWIQKHGRSDRREWARYEYRGPMFYKLAHTSMTRWQKKIADMLVMGKVEGSKIVYDPKKGYLWSSIDEQSKRKHGEKALQFPDNTTVNSFLDTFVGLKGEKVFQTTPIEGSLVNDFYVKMIVDSAEVFSEKKFDTEVKAAEVEDEEIYDL